MPTHSSSDNAGRGDVTVLRGEHPSPARSHPARITSSPTKVRLGIASGQSIGNHASNIAIRQRAGLGPDRPARTARPVIAWPQSRPWYCRAMIVRTNPRAAVSRSVWIFGQAG